MFSWILIYIFYFNCVTVFVKCGAQNGDTITDKEMKTVPLKPIEYHYFPRQNYMEKMHNKYEVPEVLKDFSENEKFYNKNDQHTKDYFSVETKNSISRKFLQNYFKQSSKRKENTFYNIRTIRKQRSALTQDLSSNYSVSEMKNVELVEKNITIEYIHLELNWQKFTNTNKLGYRIGLSVNGTDEGQWDLIGDSKPEYVLNHLKPNSTYMAQITPVSCKLQVQFNIKTPRLISGEDAISFINSVNGQEKNLTSIRNIGITFKNSLFNETGYVLQVELLTRYNEGSKSIVVQIIKLITGIKQFTVSYLKPHSIYRFSIYKNQEMLNLSEPETSYYSFYIFTGNTDNFKSSIPLPRDVQPSGLRSKFSAMSIGVTPRRTVTCYVENETPFSGYACRSSDICIPMNWVCDGEDDCEDGDDELNCRPFGETNQLDRSVCRKHEFRCFSRGEQVCLPISWLCDGRRDCADGWDEYKSNCRRTYNRPGSTTYNVNAVVCESDYFRCFNGRGCVAPEYLCDGDNDCSDGSDEWRCKRNTRCNARNEFQCFYDDTPFNLYSSYNNHRCIPKSWVCDDQDDCPNGEDESVETCNLIRRLGSTTSGLFSLINKLIDPSSRY